MEEIKFQTWDVKQREAHGKCAAVNKADANLHTSF